MIKAKYEDVLQQYQKALEIELESLIGPDHVSTGDTYHCMGNALCGQGKCEDAMHHYHKALAIELKALIGPGHVSIA